ncbi:ATP-binding protein [Streptomyces hokutonensis]|uniref:ATP-binding protein n=1 Tax=Streptomyces hokutonensis TaxID=1306990 RepID=UPI0036B6326B
MPDRTDRASSGDVNKHGNLPPETLSFVGRGAELARLRAALDPDSGPARPVTVVGVGGVGKTRLALRAAARVRDAYPDGVWLTELSPLRTSGPVDLAVMESLRLADRSTRPVIDVITEWAHGRRLLLILDSCEHVLADCARFTAALRSRLPGLRVLLTSRERLALPGEEVLHLEPLPVDGRPGVDEDAGAAVALFAERAAAAGRPLGDGDSAARATAVAVCRRLDGIPLALELAAARLTELTLDQLHTRLGERLPTLPPLPDPSAPGTPIPSSPLDLLVSAPGERPPRHQTLRTAIGWSHELCAPLERLLWARLSVFSGGFCLEAVRQICAGGPLPPERIAGLLDRLVAQSIVLPDPVISARYRMLDTVREYGADWLHALGEERAVRRRHRDHYARLAREGCAEWNTGRQVAWCERVLTEHANLRTAVDYALAEPDGAPATTVEMAGHVGFLWRHCGYLREAQHCLDQALAAESPPGPGRTLALWSRGAVALLQGDQEAAANWAVRCADAAREQGSPVAQVAAAYLRGGHLALTGRQAEAIAVLDAAPRLPVHDDGFGAAQLQARLALSLAHVLRGKFERGREVADEVRTASRKQGEYWCGAFADYLIAQVDLAHGDMQAAVLGARTSIAGHALLHNTVGAAMSLDLLAAAVVTTGDAHRAARLLGIGTRLWELTGRAQMDSPDLIATRRTCELRVREQLGEDAYETGYRAGLAMTYDEGIAYAAIGQ